MNKFATYKPHCFDNSEGHIFLDKDGACTITLTGAASMSQAELDYYGDLFTNALNSEAEHASGRQNQWRLNDEG